MALELDSYIKLNKAAIRSANLADSFSDRDLDAISEFVWDGYQKDLFSRADWYRRTEAAMDLAMQVVETKSFPWPNASNVTFPLVTIAALQFHARAYPAIIQGTEVVKCRVTVGAAPGEVDRADRIGRYMSYQVLEEDSSWEEGHDRLLINIPIVGCAFKKSFYNARDGYNNSQLVLARDLVVNYYAKSIETARRKTHVVLVYRNEMYERAMAGTYRDITEEPWFNEAAQHTVMEGSKSDARQGLNPPNTDWATPYRCLEQHTWLDLDGDGYEEPYIVTIEENSKCVLRIVSRVDNEEHVQRRHDGKVMSIRASEYFTKYGFIPAPDGGIYDIGFGVLVGPLNESVNSIINQLIDAGTMANTAGGFLGRGVKVRSGNYSFAPMEWKRLDSTGDDIKKNIYPLPVREPSDVLFKLLGLLVDYTNRISGATEMLAGENPGQNTKVGTVDTMVEQGLKIYGAIFKRIWRSMKEEFKKLYILNALHLPFRAGGVSGVTIGREDFLGDPNHIVPCADPNVTSDKMRMQIAMFLSDRAMRVPGYNRDKVEMNLLRVMRVDEPSQFYVGAKQAPLPNPIMMREEARGKFKLQEVQLKIKHDAETMVLKMQEEHALNEAKISELEAQATNLLAQAKGVDISQQINAINSIVGAMRAHNDHLVSRAKIILESMSNGNEGGRDHSGAISHLVGGPGDAGNVPPPGIPGGGEEGAMG